ncbi:MAG: AAA family ATPase, partial [Clostridia bacterium]|nr:AAA family ATPase [Clostridia bacterium]
MIVSHSRIECFEGCPYRYDLKYNQGIKTIPPDNADNALFLGTALHTGLEKGVEAAVHEYFMSYPVITDAHINEAMKLEYIIPKAKALIPDDGEFEVKIEDDDFIGFIDLLVPSRTEQKLNGEHQILPNVYDLYDFKYSNNVSKYKDSPQLHLYKYFWEKNNPGKVIRNLYFLFVPKVNIKQKKTEDLFQFRKRIQDELQQVEPSVVPIEYDPEKVIQWMCSVKHSLEATEFPKSKSWLCNYCEYNDYCQKGNDFMNLPSTERRQVGQTTKRKIWIYGAAFSGKTTMLDDAPNPLNLNTDGNIQFVTMPYVSIKDEVTVNGRMTNRKFAWNVFKDTIAELEKKQNEFQTIIIDLLEDTREMCRIYMYDSLNIQHESDSGFGKGWDIIKTEYLSTMRRFFNLDYENLVVISHEDISKDITKKNGQNITRIAPNIQDAIANKIAGMVDIVARVVVEDDDSRTLNFKQNEVIFGGGRLKGITQTSIPLSWDALMDVYDQANQSTETPSVAPQKPTSTRGRRTSQKEEK